MLLDPVHRHDHVDGLEGLVVGRLAFEVYKGGDPLQIKLIMMQERSSLPQRRKPNLVQNYSTVTDLARFLG